MVENKMKKREKREAKQYGPYIKKLDYDLTNIITYLTVWSMKANNNVTTWLGAKFHGTEFQISWCV